MVTDNEPDVVDRSTNHKTPLLHQNPPTATPDILHDDVHGCGVLQTLLEHRSICNRLSLIVGYTAAGCLDSRHSAIDLWLSVTNLLANALEELRCPSELKPDVKLEPAFGEGINLNGNHSPIERTAQMLPSAGHATFHARKTALHEIGRRRIGSNREEIVETLL